MKKSYSAVANNNYVTFFQSTFHPPKTFQSGKCGWNEADDEKQWSQ